MVSPSSSNSVYNDFSGLAKLRAGARQNPDENLQEVARQFESIYLQMMLKSMREASMGDPLFDSSSSDMYRDMFDNQMALQLTQGKGVGLAELLVQQLRRNQSAGTEGDLRQDLAASVPHGNNAFISPADFTQKLMPLAQKAASELGTTPEVLIAQAALETGWGKHIQRQTDGSSSYNLFNIKADASWDGKRVLNTTVEYDKNIPKRQHAVFRAYDSYDAAFNDYVKLMKNSSRYQNAMNVASNANEYVRQVHAAGYATDPAYATKWLELLHKHFTPGEG